MEIMGYEGTLEDKVWPKGKFAKEERKEKTVKAGKQKKKETR